MNPLEFAVFFLAPLSLSHTHTHLAQTLFFLVVSAEVRGSELGVLYFHVCRERNYGAKENATEPINRRNSLGAERLGSVTGQHLQDEIILMFSEKFYVKMMFLTLWPSIRCYFLR